MVIRDITAEPFNQMRKYEVELEELLVFFPTRDISNVL